MNVLLVHGLWLHAASWGPWEERLRAAGYTTASPGWPGEPASIDEARAQPQLVGGYGIDAIVDHYVQAISALDSSPIVIGHSFGGLIAQRLLAEGHAAAAVGIDAAPIKGVLFLPPSALRVASVALRNPLNRNRAVALSRQQFRYGFGNAVTAQESDELYERWAVASPGKPLFEAATAALSPGSPAKVDTQKAARGPLLLTAGGKDRTVPAIITKQTARLYHKSPAVTDVREFPDRGHSLCIDSGWEEVADTVVDWLKAQGL